MAKHELFGGKLHLYKRENSRHWQCATFLEGRNHRRSTKAESLAQARDIAEDWYLELHGKHRRGEKLHEKTFKDAAAQFITEYEIITEGQRSGRWVEGHKARIRLHLEPFLGNLGLSQITAGKVQEYRIHRKTKPADWEEKNKRAWKAPSHSTLHDEVVTLRQVLKTAIRHGWLDHLPDLSMPYRGQAKVIARPWFSPQEYKQLYTATRNHPRTLANGRHRQHAEDLHDFVLFMANTGLRPDEAYNLQHRDVEIVEDDETDETILVIEVRGKRGFGYCKSMSNAVRPYRRILERRRPDHTRPLSPDNAPAPTDMVFPNNHLRMFNTVLEQEGLKESRDGQKRTSYSLRHTYICLRLMEGADIYQIAKNCRTSVEMIEKHYASHIKNSISTAAVNVRRPKKPKKPGLPGGVAVESEEPPHAP
ncbi:tyrosine-type recombinase/integrase [Hyphococcus sp.]|uniref:tyrosine-type recombinase/integrase n=1 Tax=Hyphococcus sp. TaxID=2038636 RepID=UPI003D11B63A